MALLSTGGRNLVLLSIIRWTVEAMAESSRRVAWRVVEGGQVRRRKVSCWALHCRIIVPLGPSTNAWSWSSSRRIPSTVLLTKFDLKHLVSRYPIECCIGGKPVLHCDTVGGGERQHWCTEIVRGWRRHWTYCHLGVLYCAWYRCWSP